MAQSTKLDLLDQHFYTIDSSRLESTVDINMQSAGIASDISGA
jgi:hypothetical protein